MSKDLKKAIQGIIKDFEDARVLHDKKSTVLPLTTKTTGFAGLDQALRIGGFPSGCFAEIYGAEAMGKTTFGIQFLVAGQRLGEDVAFIDVEHHLDTDYAKALGLKFDKSSVIVQPADGEDGFEIVRRLLEAGVQRIVIDSMAALQTKAEIETAKKSGPGAPLPPGIHARLMSRASKMLNSLLYNSGAVVLYTNQTRSDINPFGPSETTTGGRAVRFYERTRIRLSRDSSKRGGDWGFWTKCDIKKNNYGKPGGQWTGRLIYGKGFDEDYDLVQTAIDMGIIVRKEKSNWYLHQGQELGVGIEKTVDKMREDPETKGVILKDLKGE